MKKLIATLAAVAVLGLALPASASLLSLRRFGASTEKISAQTLASSRSLAIAGEKLTGYDTLILWVEVTDTGNEEVGVSLTCNGQMNPGGSVYRIPACVWDATNVRFNCEAGPLFWNPTDETSPKRQIFRYRTLGAPNVTCTFTFTTGSASDSISVDVFAAVAGG